MSTLTDLHLTEIHIWLVALRPESIMVDGAICGVTSIRLALRYKSRREASISGSSIN
jgi:hypothetical protein